VIGSAGGQREKKEGRAFDLLIPGSGEGYKRKGRTQASVPKPVAKKKEREGGKSQFSSSMRKRNPNKGEKKLTTFPFIPRSEGRIGKKKWFSFYVPKDRPEPQGGKRKKASRITLFTSEGSRSIKKGGGGKREKRKKNRAEVSSRENEGENEQGRKGGGERPVSPAESERRKKKKEKKQRLLQKVRQERQKGEKKKEKTRLPASKAGEEKGGTVPRLMKAGGTRGGEKANVHSGTLGRLEERRAAFLLYPRFTVKGNGEHKKNAVRPKYEKVREKEKREKRP